MSTDYSSPEASACDNTRPTGVRWSYSDYPLITVILISMAYIYQKSMIEMVLYGLIPFNISCTCYLFICAKSRTNDSLYHLIACMIFLSGTFSLVLHQRFIFEASMFWGWIGFYVLSIILLGKTLQLYLKKEKMIGELIWNLQ